MKISAITPLILTLDEEANIDRVLKMLTWAKQIVVLDSGSNDRTCKIASGYPNVRLSVRPFDCHANQWNFGLHGCGIDTEWVLALDADYVLTQELIEEFGCLVAAPELSGYWIPFKYCVFGRPLWGSLYPPRLSLFRRRHGKYEQDGHTQRLILKGETGVLRSFIFHDDRKPLSRWLDAQWQYAELEAEKLASLSYRDLRWPDRLRKMVLIAPWICLLFCLFWKMGIVQGRAGLFYAFQRTLAELLISVSLLERTFLDQYRD